MMAHTEVDRYAERIALGECAWCSREAVWTVEFEKCAHTTPCCDDHFGEYFLGMGWERYYEAEEDFDATCPETI